MSGEGFISSAIETARDVPDRVWRKCDVGCERGDGIICPDDACDIADGFVEFPRRWCPKCEEPRHGDDCWRCDARTVA